MDLLRTAGDRTDEPLWELPIERRYRKELDSDVADLKNLGGANAGAITAALFLQEFVGQVERVTPAAVLRFARTYFDAERRVEGVVRGTRV